MVRRAMTTIQHPTLGRLRGIEVNQNLIQFRSLPYASIKQRFARSQLLDRLPLQHGENAYDATKVGPSSVQPLGAARMDANSNQLPSDIIKGEQSQSEDCLRVTITAPTDQLGHNKSILPVLVFLHGMLISGPLFPLSSHCKYLVMS